MSVPPDSIDDELVNKRIFTVVPHSAGFCVGHQTQILLKIIDFQEYFANCLRLSWSHLDSGAKIKYRDYQTFNPGVETWCSRLLLLQISMFFRHVGHD